MGCSSCSVDSNGTPKGCGDKGHCSSGSCNKLSTYDWIATRDLFDPTEYNIVEVSFKKGSHKDFFINDPSTRTITGDMVVVETASGYDIGRISLSGELVRMQMKKKFTSEDRVGFKIIRRANERDLEKLEEARLLEKETMVKSRVIARTMGLDMKLGDVEYQGDKKKATFYYTAEGRVDFRELVKEYAKEFKVKIEMRQIGARQESARIGGIGSCGRELCCSTWLSDFKSVNTAAARYQNIAINQSKLSGQCGRLKCCLNYELDTYMDALEDFPEDVDRLKTKAGTANLIKTDIFKGLLYYIYDNEKMRGTIIAVEKERVKAVKEMNKKGIFPDELAIEKAAPVADSNNEDSSIEHEYEDVTGLIELRNEPNRKKKKKPQGQQNRPNPNQQKGQSGGDKNNPSNTPNQGTRNGETDQQKPSDKPNQNPNQRPKNPNQNSNQRPNTPNQQKPANKPVQEGDSTKNPNQNQQAGANKQHPKPQHNRPNPPKNEQNPNQENQPNQNPDADNSNGQNPRNNNKKKKFFNKNRKPKDGQ